MPSTGDQEPADAARFLETLGQRALDELTDASITERERERRFRRLFNEAFDVRAISRFVLGGHWRRASDAERRDFLQVFEDAAVQRFLPMFADFGGQNFSIGRYWRDEVRPSHVFVTTEIFQPGLETIVATWRMREWADQYRILDVVAEGVSMAITLRQEYDSVVRREGVGGLVAALRRKLQAGAFAPRTSQAR